MGALNRLMRLDPTLFNDFYETNKEGAETRTTKDMDAQLLSKVKGTIRQPTAFEVYSTIKCVSMPYITVYVLPLSSSYSAPIMSTFLFIHRGHTTPNTLHTIPC